MRSYRMGNLLSISTEEGGLLVNLPFHGYATSCHLIHWLPVFALSSLGWNIFKNLFSYNTFGLTITVIFPNLGIIQSNRQPIVFILLIFICLENHINLISYKSIKNASSLTRLIFTVKIKKINENHCFCACGKILKIFWNKKPRVTARISLHIKILMYFIYLCIEHMLIILMPCSV